MALQTKTFTYGGLNNSASRYFRTELTLREISVDGEKNTSLLAYTLILYAGNTRLSGYRTGARIILGGKEYVHRDGADAKNQITIRDQTNVTLCQGEVTVPHDADGTCDLSVSFSVYHPVVASYTPGNFTYTGGTMTLTPIPKANMVFATDGYIGGFSMVAIHRKNKGYSHSLYYEMGSSTGYLTPEGLHSDTEVIFDSLSVPFALPESFYEELPAEKRKQCSLTCRTYADGKFMGEGRTTFWVMTNRDLCAPMLTAAVQDVSESTLTLTGDAGTLVRFASQAECTLTATTQKGAQLISTTIEGKNCTALTVDMAEKESYCFSVTDSRGYREEKVVSLPMIPYVRLTVYPEVSWEGENLRLQVTGSYFSGNFGVRENSLTLFCTLPDGSVVHLTPECQNQGYAAAVSIPGLTPGQTISITAQDALMTVTETLSVPRSLPVFHWGEDRFSVLVPASISGVHMCAASCGEGLSVDAPQGLLVCGAGVLGVATSSGWQGTAGVTVTTGAQGQMHLTLPGETRRVMLLSPGEITIA